MIVLITKFVLKTVKVTGKMCHVQLSVIKLKMGLQDKNKNTKLQIQEIKQAKNVSLKMD